MIDKKFYVVVSQDGYGDDSGKAAFESEQEARDEIQQLAVDNPGIVYHLLATIDTCVLPATSVQWGSGQKD